MENQNFKHSLRDSIIFLLTVSGMAFIYRKLFVRRPFCRIVVFHDVPDAAWFELMIKTLVESFNVITPNDFYTGTLNPQQINVLVTFDDGYASWSKTALPILKKYNVKGLFFINSGLIDVAETTHESVAFMEEQLRISPKKALSWKGVETLQNEGHTIGGHARSHANLATLSGELLEKEIREDKEVIAAKLQREVTDFAYPFGTRSHINNAVVASVSHLGYARAYTAVTGFTSTQETFTIPRMCIESGLSPRDLRIWVKGAYDIFSMMKRICVR